MNLTTVKLVRKCHLGGVGRFLDVQPNVAAGLIRDGLAEKRAAPAVQTAPRPQQQAPKRRKAAATA